MDNRGPLDGIMDQRINDELDEIAMIEFARIAMELSDVDFTAHDRRMFMVGFAACLVSITREAADR